MVCAVLGASNTIPVAPGHTLAGPVMEAGTGAVAADTHMLRGALGILQVEFKAVTLNQPPVNPALAVTLMLLVLLLTVPVNPAGRVQVLVTPATLGTLKWLPLVPGQRAVGPEIDKGALATSTPIHTEYMGPAAPQLLLVPYTPIQPPVNPVGTLTFTNVRLWFP